MHSRDRMIMVVPVGFLSAVFPTQRFLEQSRVDREPPKTTERSQ